MQLKPADIDEELSAWCLATERTAARAAVSAVFDLDAAARVFSLDRGNPSRVPVEEKMEYLERWVLSDEFAAVIQQNGGKVEGLLADLRKKTTQMRDNMNKNGAAAQ